VTALDIALLDRVDHAQRRDDLPRSEHPDIELPPVAADTRLDTCSDAPKSVSRLFGKLEAAAI
jgi:hypothetical protein